MNEERRRFLAAGLGIAAGVMGDELIRRLRMDERFPEEEFHTKDLGGLWEMPKMERGVPFMVPLHGAIFVASAYPASEFSQAEVQTVVFTGDSEHFTPPDDYEFGDSRYQGSWIILAEMPYRKRNIYKTPKIDLARYGLQPGQEANISFDVHGIAPNAQHNGYVKVAQLAPHGIHPIVIQ